MHPQYQAYNPNRQPTWRFERALKVASARSQSVCPKRSDDALVWKLWRFLLARKAARKHQQKADLFNANPGLYFAYRIFESPDEELRFTIEARILAGMDDAAIAKLNATLPQTIAWYEAAFFDVRDRLHVRDWVERVVLQPALQQAAADPVALHRAVCKLFAYHGGPLVLEALLSGFRPKGTGEAAWAELNDYFANHFEQQLRARLAVASHSLEINKFNFADLMGSHAKLKELQLRAQTGELEKSEYTKNVQALLGKLEVSIGTEPAKLKVLQMHQDSAFELRSDEQLKLAYGLEVPGLEELAKETRPTRRRPEETTGTAGSAP